jgi:hypothetical protein
MAPDIGRGPALNEVATRGALDVKIQFGFRHQVFTLGFVQGTMPVFAIP